MRILVLGGTTEASALAARLAARGVDAVFSYAGRIETPRPQPLPLRIGGFGGVEGLARYLRDEAITHLIDATHPFAATMSRHAVEACAIAGVPLVGLERPAWVAGPGDAWVRVADAQSACAALPDAPARVFLAIGRQTLAAFGVKPQHQYLVRVVDPQEGVPLAHASFAPFAPPFTSDAEVALLTSHAITHVVAKNSGGAAGRAKIDAARALGLPVIMIERPATPERRTVASAGEALDWLDHGADRGV